MHKFLAKDCKKELLTNTIANVLQETFVWQHDEIQRELDKLVVKAHDDLYDLNRISDQQDKANLLSTDIFGIPVSAENKSFTD